MSSEKLREVRFFAVKRVRGGEAEWWDDNNPDDPVWNSVLPEIFLDDESARSIVAKHGGEVVIFRQADADKTLELQAEVKKLTNEVARLKLLAVKLCDVACGNCRIIDNMACNTCLVENQDLVIATEETHD